MKRGLGNSIAAVALAAGAALTACSAFLGPKDDVQIVNDPSLGPTRTFTMEVDPAGYTGVTVKEAQGKYTLLVTVMHEGPSSAVGAVGDKTELSVGSNTLTYENAVEAKPLAKQSSGDIITQWQLTFRLDADQAKRLSEGPLKAVKAHISGHEVPMTLPDELAAKFQANMKIMTSPPGAASAAAGAPPPPAK